MASVYLSDEQADLPVDPPSLIAIAESVLDEEGVPADCEVSVILVDEPAMSDLNRRFMGSAGPTDVLAFPIDELGVEPGRWPDGATTGPGRPMMGGDDEVPFVLGDVVLCPTVAQRAARERSSTLNAELAMLLVHGLLHLLGLDHAVEEEARAMFARQRAHLERMGIPVVEPETGPKEQ